MARDKIRAPWEDIQGPVYHDQPARVRKAYVKPLMWAVVFVLLYVGIATRLRAALILGFLYALALTMDRQVVVSRRGLEVFNDMRITHHEELLPWTKIDALTYEEKPRTPGAYLLYFTSGDRTRSHFFPKEYWNGIRTYALNGNPSIRIYNGEEYKKQLKNAKKPVHRR